MIKISRVAILAVAVAALIASVSAQVHGRGWRSRPIPGRPAPAPSSTLNAIAEQYEIAVGSMRNALPVYDGHRSRAVRWTYDAFVQVEQASGARGGVGPGPEVVDTVPSNQADQEFSVLQISDSLGCMRRALFALETASRMLRAIPGNASYQQSAMTDTQRAIAEVLAAIRLHGVPR
jgi:hypothetical protein